MFYMGRFELGASCVVLVIMALAYGLEITSRWIAGISIIYVQEISMACWVWLVFMAAPYTFKTKRFIAIEFIYNRFPPKIQRAVGILIYLLTMVFCFIVVKESIVYFRFQSDATTEIIDLPENIFLIPVIYAGISIFLTSLYDVCIYWKEGTLSKID